MLVLLLVWILGESALVRQLRTLEDKICGSLLWSSGTALIGAAFLL